MSTVLIFMCGMIAGYQLASIFHLRKKEKIVDRALLEVADLRNYLQRKVDAGK